MWIDRRQHHTSTHPRTYAIYVRITRRYTKATQLQAATSAIIIIASWWCDGLYIYDDNAAPSVMMLLLLLFWLLYTIIHKTCVPFTLSHLTTLSSRDACLSSVVLRHMYVWRGGWMVRQQQYNTRCILLRILHSCTYVALISQNSDRRK